MTLPRDIGGLDVPQDDVSAATWDWARRELPEYLFNHSVRAFAWGAEIAAGEGWAFDRQILWTASLLHDLGLRRVGENTMCFEFEGAEFARRFLERRGMPATAADRAAIAIILHMQASVTLDDGVEAVLLDRSTSLDVRGAGYETVDRVRDDVMRGSRAGHSIATSSPRSDARSQSGGPARAPVSSTRSGSPTGWLARHGRRVGRHGPISRGTR